MKKVNLSDVKVSMFNLSVELDDKMIIRKQESEGIYQLILVSQQLCEEDSYFKIVVSFDKEKECIKEVKLADRKSVV